MRLLTSPNEFYCMALVKNPIVIFNFELDSNQLNEKKIQSGLMMIFLNKKYFVLIQHISAFTKKNSSKRQKTCLRIEKKDFRHKSCTAHKHIFSLKLKVYLPIKIMLKQLMLVWWNAVGSKLQKWISNQTQRSAFFSLLNVVNISGINANFHFAFATFFSHSLQTV